MLGIDHSDLTSRCRLSLYGCALLTLSIEACFLLRPGPMRGRWNAASSAGLTHRAYSPKPFLAC